MAGVYKALCDEISCSINIEAKGITTPEGFMPAHRIVQWFKGGGGHLKSINPLLLLELEG